MGDKKKNAGKYRKMRANVLCVSVTLALILLGLAIFSVLVVQNISVKIMESVPITVLLKDDLDEQKIQQQCEKLLQQRYIKSVNHIDKEQTLSELSAVLESDPVEFLGYNPFFDALEVRILSDFVNKDSLNMIAIELKKDSDVVDVAYQEDLISEVNANLLKVKLVLIVVVALLVCASIWLINNAIKLSIYSQRFFIQSQKLASIPRKSIRKPHVRSALKIGLKAGIIACVVIGLGIYGLFSYQPNVKMVVTWQEMTITGVSVVLLGLIVPAICSRIAVNKFLKMPANELYKM